MKTFIVIGFIIVCSSTTFATSINIISQTHRVWGGLWTWFQESPIQSYDFTDTHAISGNIEQTGVSWDKSIRSSAGNFQASAFPDGEGGVAAAYAESTYLFAATKSILSLTITGFIGDVANVNKAKFSLIDLTADIELTDYVSPVMPLCGFEINLHQDFKIDTSHQYKFLMYVETQRGEGNGGADLNVVITPEPMTAIMLLFGAGLFSRKHR